MFFRQVLADPGQRDVVAEPLGEILMMSDAPFDRLVSTSKCRKKWTTAAIELVRITTNEIPVRVGFIELLGHQDVTHWPLPGFREVRDEPGCHGVGVEHQILTHQAT